MGKIESIGHFICEHAECREELTWTKTHLFCCTVIQIIFVVLHVRCKLKKVLAQSPTPKHASKYTTNKMNYFLHPALTNNHYSARLYLVLPGF